MFLILDLRLFRYEGPIIAFHPFWVQWRERETGDGLAELTILKMHILGRQSNLFQEMNFASLVYKGNEQLARCVDADEVVKFATVNGAKALGMEGELGVISEGALADLILLDLTEPEFVPRNNLVSALCYSANGSEVTTMLVNGEIVMEDRKILRFDEEEVYAKCDGMAKRLGVRK